jgi:hypothetical protein
MLKICSFFKVKNLSKHLVSHLTKIITNLVTKSVSFFVKWLIARANCISVYVSLLLISLRKDAQTWKICFLHCLVLLYSLLHFTPSMATFRTVLSTIQWYLCTTAVLKMFWYNFSFYRLFCFRGEILFLPTLKRLGNSKDSQINFWFFISSNILNWLLYLFFVDVWLRWFKIN